MEKIRKQKLTQEQLDVACVCLCLQSSNQKAAEAGLKRQEVTCCGILTAHHQIHRVLQNHSQCWCDGKSDLLKCCHGYRGATCIWAGPSCTGRGIRDSRMKMEERLKSTGLTRPLNRIRSLEASTRSYLMVTIMLGSIQRKMFIHLPTCLQEPREDNTNTRARGSI